MTNHKNPNERIVKLGESRQKDRDKFCDAVGTGEEPSNKTTNGINLDYDYNTEYGDGDVPDVDK